MTQDHPTTPPPELVQQWINEENGVFAEHVATQAARWGSDQELEACCIALTQDVLVTSIYEEGDKVAASWRELASIVVRKLRSVRRPKPPSLKQQALKALDSSVELCEFPREYDTIRRALEALPD